MSEVIFWITIYQIFMFGSKAGGQWFSKNLVKFIYSEKTTNFCEIFTLLLTGTTKDLREGWTDARSAVGFCLGSGLFGSYNSD